MAAIIRILADSRIAQAPRRLSGCCTSSQGRERRRIQSKLTFILTCIKYRKNRQGLNTEPIGKTITSSDSPRQVLLQEHLLVDVLASQTHTPLVEHPGHGAEDALGMSARGRGAQVLPGTNSVKK